MRKASFVAAALVVAFIMSPIRLFAVDTIRATTLDNAPYPDYNYTRANRLPMTGYFEKSFDVNGTKRTAKIYIAPNTPIRAYYTVISIPDGVDANDFIVASGWKELADANEEGLFVLEPGPSGWGSPETEQAYLNAAIGFYRGNAYFSIFGENYLVGYGKGGTALEAWAAANPLLVCSQVYVGTESQSDSFYAQFATKQFDGLSSGYKKIDIPANIRISYNSVPVPTWYISSDLSAVGGGSTIGKPRTTVWERLFLSRAICSEARSIHRQETRTPGKPRTVARFRKWPSCGKR